MKKIAVITLLALFAYATIRSSAQQGVRTAFSTLVVTNNHLVATNIASTNMRVMRATFIGMKAGSVSNTAAIYLGTSTNLQPYIIHPGERHIIDTTPGTHFSLSEWWLKVGSSGDGVTVLYQ